ncbi:MAG: hypothetical protein ACYDEC_09570 [Bacteroidia bacterium]
MSYESPILNPPILNPFQRKGLAFLLPFGEVGRGRKGLALLLPFLRKGLGIGVEL